MDILPHKNKLKEKRLSDTLANKLDDVKNSVYSTALAQPTAWDRVLICRHPERPHTVDYIENICEEFIELFGDRTFSNDHAVVGGFARIDGKKFMVIGQEKGYDTEGRIHRNFGSVHPEGFRKALRLAELAEKFQLPVLFLIDTGGAFPGLSAEERGQGRAIAWNLRELARLATPIIVLIIGEGCSGGALGMGIGDCVAMLEHSYYSVISPEGCASIIWKEASKKNIAAEILKMQAESLFEFGIIDAIIKEPVGGAHLDKEMVYQNVKRFILDQEKELKKVPLDLLLENRYTKFRQMGASSNS